MTRRFYAIPVEPDALDRRQDRVHEGFVGAVGWGAARLDGDLPAVLQAVDGAVLDLLVLIKIDRQNRTAPDAPPAEGGLGDVGFDVIPGRFLAEIIGRLRRAEHQPNQVLA